MKLAAALVVLASCWSQPAAPPPIVTPPPPAHPRADLPPHSVWEGMYRCPQGPTALTLTLDIAKDGRATAVFAFGPHEGNPTVPPGSFRMSGTAEDRHGRMAITLHPGAWIEQPPVYITVGLHGETDDAGDNLTGAIDDADECTTLELQRRR